MQYLKYPSQTPNMSITTIFKVNHPVFKHPLKKPSNANLLHPIHMMDH